MRKCPDAELVDLHIAVPSRRSTLYAHWLLDVILVMKISTMIAGHAVNMRQRISGPSAPDPLCRHPRQRPAAEEGAPASWCQKGHSPPATWVSLSD